jgi:hypothetical protein
MKPLKDINNFCHNSYYCNLIMKHKMKAQQQILILTHNYVCPI